MIWCVLYCAACKHTNVIRYGGGVAGESENISGHECCPAIRLADSLEWHKVPNGVMVLWNEEAL